MGGLLSDIKGRVGDQDHGIRRFVNMFKKRLTSSLIEWVQGVPSMRNIMARFVDTLDDLQGDAKSIPAAERLFQKRTKEDQFDMSTSKLSCTSLLLRLTWRLATLGQHFPMWQDGGGICLGCFACVAVQFHKPLWFVEGACATNGCTNQYCSGTHRQDWGV